MLLGICSITFRHCKFWNKKFICCLTWPDPLGLEEFEHINFVLKTKVFLPNRLHHLNAYI